MRLGFVGVGPWAQKLATAFRECGAEIARYDRAQHGEFPDKVFSTPIRHECDGHTHHGSKFSYQSWRGQVENTELDALIICAPPDVTTEVALACAKAGKRCVATKPLVWTEAPECLPRGIDLHMSGADASEWPAARIYVDLWRLYSPAWIAMKEELRGKKIERIDVAFCGNGPFRSFNGALDYGPHALAFVFDLLGTTEVSELEVVLRPNRAEGPGQLYAAQFRCGGVLVELMIGNGTDESQRVVEARCDGGVYWFDEPNDGEPGAGCDRFGVGRFHEAGRYMCHEKILGLRRFCRAFMAGEASRTLEYSIAAQRVLERITQPVASRPAQPA